MRRRPSSEAKETFPRATTTHIFSGEGDLPLRRTLGDLGETTRSDANLPPSRSFFWIGLRRFTILLQVSGDFLLAILLQVSGDSWCRFLLRAHHTCFAFLRSLSNFRILRRPSNVLEQYSQIRATPPGIEGDGEKRGNNKGRVANFDPTSGFTEGDGIGLRFRRI